MSEFRTERVDWMFDDDVREKKKIAHQARHRKNGSRSKKCTFSIDHLTRKQWLERCGEVVTYNMKKPISWEEFCKLPVHVQKEYLLNLIQEYQTTASDLAKMFGITAQTLVRRCKNEDIGIRFSPGKRMSQEQRKAFAEFCNESIGLEIEDTVVATKPEETVETHEPEEPEGAAEPDMPVCATDHTPSQDMAMTEFTLSFAGGFSRDMVYNSLSTMIPNGTPVKLNIQCFIVK